MVLCTWLLLSLVVVVFLRQAFDVVVYELMQFFAENLRLDIIAVYLLTFGYSLQWPQRSGMVLFSYGLWFVVIERSLVTISQLGKNGFWSSV